MNRSRIAAAALFACCAALVSRSDAVTITPDYSSLGSVYQDAAGNLYTAAGAGRSDITANVKLDVSTAVTYLQGAITLPWNESISFNLFDNGDDSIVGDSAINTITGDAAKRPAT